MQVWANNRIAMCKNIIRLSLLYILCQYMDYIQKSITSIENLKKLWAPSKGQVIWNSSKAIVESLVFPHVTHDDLYVVVKREKLVKMQDMELALFYYLHSLGWVIAEKIPQFSWFLKTTQWELVGLLMEDFSQWWQHAVYSIIEEEEHVPELNQSFPDLDYEIINTSLFYVNQAIRIGDPAQLLNWLSDEWRTKILAYHSDIEKFKESLTIVVDKR